jgi:REP element-mobilizing transposase RayT
MGIHRIDLTGIPYHVFSRGNNKETIFFEEVDYLFYLKTLREALRKFNFLLYSYALMDNHFHLLLEMHENSQLARLMHHTQLRYAAYFNRKYRRVGHIFQSRYHSNLIESDRYFLAVDRYIHLNPVRAGIVSRPQDYRWTSYSARFQTPQSDWINHGPILERFGDHLPEQWQGYRDFTESGIGSPEEWSDDLLRKTPYLASAEFVSKLRKNILVRKPQ